MIFHKVQTHLAILSDAEHSVFIVAELHTVNFSVVSPPAHSALIPLHIYSRKFRGQYVHSLFYRLYNNVYTQSKYNSLY